MRLILEGVDIFVNYLISVSVNSIPCHILGDRGAVGGDVDADSWTGGWKRSWSRLVVNWSRLGCGGWPVGLMIWLRCFHPLHCCLCQATVLLCVCYCTTVQVCLLTPIGSTIQFGNFLKYLYHFFYSPQHNRPHTTEVTSSL
jgi:hypothetical protein